MYKKITNNISVTVNVAYLEEQSDVPNDHFVWAYMVLLTNHNDYPVQLLRRQWYIMDAQGGKQSVEGEGVVGEQPHLKAGQGFQYTSGTVLHTPSGIMEGFYTMERSDTKQRFKVTIPTFSLDSDYQVMRPN
jgi:ApaG protein